jgi:pimeloyl-ACP methyl ester carboxylesterase
VTTFVLVHGGCHGAWCWESVIEPLTVAGHRVLTVELPGRGETADRVATVTLEDWVAAVNTAIDSAADPPVLVGHSFGGLTVSELAERRGSDIAAVVYVAAIVPVDGSSGFATLMEAGATSALLDEGAIVLSEDGSTGEVPASQALKAFYGRTEPATAQAAIARMCPEALGPLLTPVSLGTSFTQVPKTYIGTTADRAVPVAFQRELADRCGARFVSVDSDHFPFYSAVDAFVETLVEHVG